MPACRVRKSLAPARRCHSIVVGSAARRRRTGGVGRELATARALGACRLGEVGGERVEGLGEGGVVVPDVLRAPPLLLDGGARTRTGLSSASIANAGLRITATITPAISSGATIVAMPKRAGGGSGLRVGGSNALGSGGRPGRGGRLKGTVAAWVRLCGVPGAGARASSAPRQTVTAAPPTTTTSPSSTVTPSSPTFSPPTKVPLVEPASRTRRMSPSSSIVAWLQERSGSRR